MLPRCWCCHGVDDAMVLMLPWGWCCHGVDVVRVRRPCVGDAGGAASRHRTVRRLPHDRLGAGPGQRPAATPHHQVAPAARLLGYYQDVYGGIRWMGVCPSHWLPGWCVPLFDNCLSALFYQLISNESISNVRSFVCTSKDLLCLYGKSFCILLIWSYTVNFPISRHWYNQWTFKCEELKQAKSKMTRAW